MDDVTNTSKPGWSFWALWSWGYYQVLPERCGTIQVMKLSLFFQLHLFSLPRPRVFTRKMCLGGFFACAKLSTGHHAFVSQIKIILSWRGLQHLKCFVIEMCLSLFLKERHKDLIRTSAKVMHKMCTVHKLLVEHSTHVGKVRIWAMYLMPVMLEVFDLVALYYQYTLGF